MTICPIRRQLAGTTAVVVVVVVVVAIVGAAAACCSLLLWRRERLPKKRNVERNGAQARKRGASRYAGWSEQFWKKEELITIGNNGRIFRPR